MKIIFFALSLFVNCAYSKPTEITFWHSLAGQPGQELTKLIEGFNNIQQEYLIKPTYKGGYLNTLTSFTAAFRAKKPPHMIQIFEVGSPIMRTPIGIIKPVEEIIQNENITINYQDFYPGVLDYYSYDGHLLAMPFNISMPVMFYNQELLNELGFNGHFPNTWDEFENLLIKIKQKGYQCSYTSAYPAWVMIESFSAVAGLPLIDTKNNKVLYNNPKILHHLNRLLRWQKLHLFEYGGRHDDATSLFTSGKCPIFSQSSGAYLSLQKLLGFTLGVAAIPAEDNNKKFNNMIGGAAIWVVANQSDEVYKGIANFFIYLNTPAIQENWYKNTGYLPLHKKTSATNTSFLIKLAEKELNKASTVHKTGSIVMHSKIREINDEALEAIFSGIQSPAQGLTEAQIRANKVLLRFKENTEHAT